MRGFHFSFYYRPDSQPIDSWHDRSVLAHHPRQEKLYRFDVWRYQLRQTISEGWTFIGRWPRSKIPRRVWRKAKAS